MNKYQILKDFKEKGEKNKMLKLDDGYVVGTFVDEENKLWYVVENKKELTLERANKVKVEEVYWRTDNGEITASEKSFKKVNHRVRSKS